MTTSREEAALNQAASASSDTTPALTPTLPSVVPSRRAKLAQALDTIGLLDRFLWLRSRTSAPPLSVFTYHRITRTASVEAEGLDPDVVDAEPAQLEAQLAVIQSYFRVVSLEEVRWFMERRASLRNAVLVTFDDGYTDCLTGALPILRRAGVRATFFIPTAFPDSGHLFWWDKIFLLMRRAKVAEATLTYPRALKITPQRSPRDAARAVCRLVKRTVGVDLPRLFEELERVTGTSIDPAEERVLSGRALLGWRQIQELCSAGMDVQSHSHTHRVLNTMSPEDARRDLEVSRRILNDVTNRTIDTIAYPVGYRLSRELRESCRAAGFWLGFTNQTGPCGHMGVDPLEMPRMAMDIEHTVALYKLVLLLGERREVTPTFATLG